MIIGVIGGSHCTSDIYDLAYEVGVGIAKSKNIVICGGRSGVMEAVCRGAKSQNGLTIGVLPGRIKEEANQWVDIPIVTGMGVARNVIIVRSADAIIAINGSYGTLSELAIASNLGIPIVGLLTWEVDLPIKRVNLPEEAVGLAIKMALSTEDKERRTAI
ncbi:MAG: TIGR00725 family protein [Candidatus Stahlbacteria bacterium]|nr:TIGR00725 family protein [Candidatus Stahlbacteria bacterium]